MFDPAVGVSVDLPEMPVVPQVAVKTTNDVDVPLDRGGVLSLAEQSTMTRLEPDHFLLQAIEALVPNLVARLLFEDLDNATWPRWWPRRSRRTRSTTRRSSPTSSWSTARTTGT